MADAAGAREQAREILADGRYQETSVPRPFRGVLGWAGDRIQDVGSWFTGLFDDVDGALPGGIWVTWVVLGVLVAVAAVLIARAAIRRRVEAAEATAASERAAESDPRVLEREADAAERAGDFEHAVRLRFRAGVLRLDRERDTTGAIAADLHDPDFDRIGDEHDRIAYGGRPASDADASSSREGWREVLR